MEDIRKQTNPKLVFAKRQINYSLRKRERYRKEYSQTQACDSIKNLEGNKQH